jgi:uncharacterized iron-regulated protein
MENKKIIEGNKLIAEFMEVKNVREYELNSKHKCLIISDDDGFIDYVEGINFLSYNDNWNRIMPVVEKIKKLEFEFNTFSDYTKTEKYRNEVRISELSVDKYCRILIRNTDMLDAIFNAVVEFIKWYNENKNK